LRTDVHLSNRELLSNKFPSPKMVKAKNQLAVKPFFKMAPRLPT